jgi:DNA-binding MarR family transcriptional regulator
LSFYIILLKYIIFIKVVAFMAKGGGVRMTDAERIRPLVQQCTEAMVRLATVAKPEGSDWFDLEMSMGQLKAVIALNCSGPLTVGGLARVLGLAEPSASILVDKLEKIGFATRESDSADRRRTSVVVTEAGLELVSRLRRIRDDRLVSWLSELDDDKLGALLEGITALLQVMERSGLEARAKGSD